MPFGEYEDFDDCVNKNRDKDDPKAYCAAIKAKIEDSLDEVVPFSDKIEIGNPSVLKNVIRFPVTLAREMVQRYHRTELPSGIRSLVPSDQKWVSILKPYSELVKAIDGKEKIPIVIGANHPSERHPQEGSALIDGWIRDIRADDKDKAIKGMGYVPTSKIPVDLLDRINAGVIVDVSVGGDTNFGGGGSLNGQDYFFSQRDIDLGHLLVITQGKGRCGAPLCGVNLDKMPEDSPDLYMLHSHFIDGLEENSDSLISDTGTENIPNSEGNSIQDSQQVTTTDGEMNMEQDEKIKQLNAENDKLRGDIADLQKSISAKELKDLTTINETLKSSNEKLGKELADLKSDHEDDHKRLKDFEDKERAALIDSLVQKTQFTKEALADKCLHDLRVMSEALSGVTPVLADKSPGSGTFPKPEQGKEKTGGKTKGSLGDAAIDMSALEAEMAKERQTKGVVVK